MAEKVGRGRILVCYGGGDQLVAVGLAEALVQQMNAGVTDGGDGLKFVILRAQVMCWRWSSTDKLVELSKSLWKGQAHCQCNVFESGH